MKLLLRKKYFSGLNTLFWKWFLFTNMILDEFNGTAPLVYSGTNMTGSCSSHSKCILHLDFFTFFAFWGIDQVFLSCRAFTNLSRLISKSEIFKKPSKDIIRRFKYACSTGGKALRVVQTQPGSPKSFYCWNQCRKEMDPTCRDISQLWFWMMKF